MRILKGNKAEGKAMTPILKIFREEIFHKLAQCLLRVSQKNKAIKLPFENFILNSGIYPPCNLFYFIYFFFYRTYVRER